MRSSFAASTTLLTLAAAYGPPNGWSSGGGGWIGAVNAFPSCVNDCWTTVRESCDGSSDYSCMCGNDAITTANSCIADSNCSDDEKDDTYQAIAQLCANAGASVTVSPEATWSATSSGSAWPSGWKTMTAGPWKNGGGWNPTGGWGPFGRGGDGDGWGQWASKSDGDWTKGPWTRWWGGDACPASTWSGWTSASWASDAPWTTWSNCVATTTATSVVTTTLSGEVTTTTDFGIQVAQATNDPTPEGAAARETGRLGMARSAFGAVGIVAGALML